MNASDAKNNVAQLEKVLADAAAGREVEMVVPLAPSASARSYYRVRFADGGPSLIGTVGTDSRENHSFLYLARHFAGRGLPVPQIVGSSPDGMAYLQTDAGDTSLYALLAAEGESERVMAIACDIIASLPAMQFEGARGLDASRCFPVAESTRQSRMWDLNYFKYDFLKAIGAEPDDSSLDDDFSRLLDQFETPEVPIGFQFRDFQCRNIVVDRVSDRWTVIDFQGGRIGNTLYDLASFAWQTRAGFSDAARRRFADLYFEAMQPYRQMCRRDFDRLLATTVLFRQLQVLGAYGLRGLVQHKPGFTEPIAATLANILGAQAVEAYPYLAGIIRRAAEIVSDRSEAGAASAVPAATEGALVIEISSFSYRKGYPADASGNGGGFVFDCRWMANPGRYDRYKLLTGRDRPVIDFLEEAGQTARFAGEAMEMVAPAVERYLERGFTHLSVAFGCTGGQHRSLRCADLLRDLIAMRFAGRNAVVHLRHREQNIEEFTDLRSAIRS